MHKSLDLIELIDIEDRASFYSSHIFHERQMNSCPIGCKGCAVSAVSNAKGAMLFNDLYDFYKDANDKQVSLKLTKVEGYDPVFVNYADNSKIAFAASVKAAVDFGHQITTPICTTGSWKSQRTKWQLEELGRLDDTYRSYKYLSGKEGCGFVLSVPREIKPFASGRYDFAEHVHKITEDIKILSAGGQVDVLIYYNSNTNADQDLAEQICKQVSKNLTRSTLDKVRLHITNFNSDTLPESCFRYQNSVLVCDRGFVAIDPASLEWGQASEFGYNAQLEKGKAVLAG